MKTTTSDSRKLERLAIACGGTGGHFYPGLSIARTFKAKKEGEVVLFLSGRHVAEQAEVAKQYGIDSVIVDSSPRPVGISTLVKCFLKLSSGFISSRRGLKALRADALLAMGSFASLPPSFAAVSMGIPLFLHDGNARTGKANRFLSYFARCLGTAFPSVNSAAVKCPSECTGMPVRPELLDICIDKQEALLQLNRQHGLHFSHAVPTILLFGGSQGAQIFNQVLPEALNNLDKESFQVIHLTGEGKYDEVKKLYVKSSFPSLVMPSCSDMGLLYLASDIVICRSGGSTISELELFGKYSLLVPYPFAAEDHQNDNARFHCSNGCGDIMHNGDCTVENMEEFIRNWLNNICEFTQRGKLAKEIAKPDASSRMLALISNSIDAG